MYLRRVCTRKSAVVHKRGSAVSRCSHWSRSIIICFRFLVFGDLGADLFESASPSPGHHLFPVSGPSSQTLWAESSGLASNEEIGERELPAPRNQCARPRMYICRLHRVSCTQNHCVCCAAGRRCCCLQSQRSGENFAALCCSRPCTRATRSAHALPVHACLVGGRESARQMSAGVRPCVDYILDECTDATLFLWSAHPRG